jgi:protein-arginine kinase activator protein McsA
MFGITLLTDRAFDTFFESFGSVKNVDLKDAKLIDTHNYTANGVVYTQRVMRLADNSIYVDTTVEKEETKKNLNSLLTKAVEEERFEDAAELRDQIKQYTA